MSLGLFMEDDTIGMVTWLDSMENGNTEEKVKRTGPIVTGS